MTFTGQTMEYTGSPAAEIDRDEAGEVWSGDSSGTEARGLAGIARDVTLLKVRKKEMSRRMVCERWICIVSVRMGNGC